MTVHIVLNEKDTPIGKLADAELHFEATDGLLAGLKLQGFGIWESRWPSRTGGPSLNVTFPARSYTVNGEQRSWALLREDTGQPDALKAAIVEAYKALFRAPQVVRHPEPPRPQPARASFQKPSTRPVPRRPAARTGTDDDYPF